MVIGRRLAMPEHQVYAPYSLKLIPLSIHTLAKNLSWLRSWVECLSDRLIRPKYQLGNHDLFEKNDEIEIRSKCIKRLPRNPYKLLRPFGKSPHSILFDFALTLKN